MAETYGKNGFNWLGELSCAVLRADFLDHGDRFCVHDDIPYFGLNDIGSFIKAATLQSLVYINQHLSIFRKSTDGLSNARGYYFSLTILARIPLGIILHDRGLLTLDRLVKLLRAVRSQWTHYYGEDLVGATLSELVDKGDAGAYPDMKSGFLTFWQWYREENPGFHHCKDIAALAEQIASARPAG